jgi:hypothetical protein
MSPPGTELPSGDVRIHGEYWRVSGPSTDVGNPIADGLRFERELDADRTTKAWYRSLHAWA